VADAFLRRSLPSTVEVTVAEREPIAVGRFGGGLYLIDGRGLVIDEFRPAHARLDLPIVDGLGGSPRSTATPDEARAGLAARLLLSFRGKPEVARRVSQVNVTDPHNAGVILSGDPAVLYVGEDRFLPKVEAYLGLAAALREQVNDIDYVDLRFDDRIYVRPGKGASASAPRPSAKSQAGGRSGRARKR
jgi:cell division septal protein FtsQ